VVVERWLGYPRQNRRVVHQKAAPVQITPTPRNLLVDWNATNNTRVHQKFNFLGVEHADPEIYERKFGNELIPSKLLPREADECNSYLSTEEVLAVNQQPKEFVLTGDVKALDLVDKQKVNLSEYLVPKWLFKN
jgi:hypothetical protein